MKNLQTFDEFLNESSNLRATGALFVEKYHEDEVYYVNTKEYGLLYLSGKFESTMDDKKLESLIGKSHTWEVIEWNHSAKKPIERYKINGLIK